MKIVYLTNTGQTKRFIKKINSVDSIEIKVHNPYFEIDENFILVVPSYEIEATEHANDFLESYNNIDKLKGVVGVGNRNFAELFCYTAKDIAVKYNVPYLYELEFQGMNKDAENITKIIEDINNGKRFLTPKELGYLGPEKSKYIHGEVEISKGVN